MPQKPSPVRAKPGGPSRRYRIQALDRAVLVLNCFDFGTTELTVKEIAAKTHLHKSTAHRILMALQHNGLVEQNEATARYHLGLDLFRLGHLAVSQLKLPDIARPFLQRLMEQTGETTHLAVLEQNEVFYVDTLESSRALKMPGRVGHRVPAYCTSLGKAMLSTMTDEQVRTIFRGQRFHRYAVNTAKNVDELIRDLAATRKRGWSLDEEEIENGVRCIGAPLLDHTGALAGAISVAGPTTRLRPDMVADVAAKVKATARAISERLGFGQIPEAALAGAR
jgi:DNA-binding IclR family transcriptional regulator